MRLLTLSPLLVPLAYGAAIQYSSRNSVTQEYCLTKYGTTTTASVPTTTKSATETFIYTRTSTSTPVVTKTPVASTTTVATTITHTSTSTAAAPQATTTETDTDTVTNTVTETDTDTETDTATSTITSTETITIPTVAGFTPIASVPSVEDNGGGDKVPPNKRSLESRMSPVHCFGPKCPKKPKFPASVTCYKRVIVYVIVTKTVTATHTYTKTAPTPPVSTSSTTVIDSTVTTITPASTTVTASTTSTETDTATQTTITTVTTTTTSVSTAVAMTTLVQACQSDNLINGVGSKMFGGLSFSGSANSFQFPTGTYTPEECCNLCQNTADCDGFLDDSSGGCLTVHSPGNCNGANPAFHILIGYGFGPMVAGDGNCGQAIFP